MNAPRPYRKHWRIALAFVLLFAVVGWFVAWPAYQRHRAIQEIERAGGFVGTESIEPQWLNQWGFELTRVHSVSFDIPDMSDRWPHHLRGLRGLRELRLNDTQFTDDELMTLRVLTSLDLLALDGPFASDNGLIHLRNVPKLKHLELYDTGISDAGFRQICGLESLESLWLHDSRIADDGLKHLSCLTKLQSLTLIDTCITDEGLKHLGDMSSLNYVCLDNSQITAEGVRKLRRMLPNCDVTWAPELTFHILLQTNKATPVAE